MCVLNTGCIQWTWRESTSTASHLMMMIRRDSRYHQSKLITVDGCLAPTEVCPAPTEVCLAPTEVCLAPTEVCLAPTEVCPAPTEVCLAPTEVCPAPTDMCVVEMGRSLVNAEVRPNNSAEQFGRMFGSVRLSNM